MEKPSVLNLLQQGLSPMPFVVINGQMILLSGIIHAEENDDGSLILGMVNGNDIPLDPEEAEELRTQLQVGIDNARRSAAVQAGKELGLIQVPGNSH